MIIQEVEHMLRSIGKDNVKRGWSTLDTKGEKTFGLDSKCIRDAAKKVPTDACLADELYGTKNHDLKFFATCIDDPETYSRDEIIKRCEQLYASPFGESFCKRILAKTPFAVECLEMWENSQDPDKQACIYYTLSALANQKNNLADEFFLKHLQKLEENLPEQDQVVQESMSKALQAACNRSSSLRKETEKIADSLSKENLSNVIERKLRATREKATQLSES